MLYLKDGCGLFFSFAHWLLQYANFLFFLVCEWLVAFAHLLSYTHRFDENHIRVQSSRTRTHGHTRPITHSLIIQINTYVQSLTDFSSAPLAVYVWIDFPGTATHAHMLASHSKRASDCKMETYWAHPFDLSTDWLMFAIEYISIELGRLECHRYRHTSAAWPRKRLLFGNVKNSKCTLYELRPWHWKAIMR